MTLENDPGCLHPTPHRKSYNPFDSDDDALDSPGLKSENAYTKDDCIGFDPKTFEKAADALAFHVGDGDFLWEEAVFGQPAANASANGHTSLSEKDGQLYTDKIVTECDLPEFIVDYKESTCQSVKDIGVDEGVPTQKKKWIRNSEDENKDSSSFLALSSERNDAMNVENDSDKADVLEAPKSKLVHECEDDDSLKITELKPDVASFQADLATTAVENAPGGLVYDTADSHPAAETHPDKNPYLIGKDEDEQDDSVENQGDNTSLEKVEKIVVQELTTGETPSDLSTESGEVNGKPDERPKPNETLPESSSKHDAVEESAYSSDSNKMASSVKMESDPGKEEDATHDVEVAKPPAAQTMTRHEEARVHGETSFSSRAPGPSASSITFSGPVTYSGSISLRSESSAGSTRSFAFPVLQTEWNSSPVRMAKADRRHYRKHRGWVQAVICCRF